LYINNTNKTSTFILCSTNNCTRFCCNAKFRSTSKIPIQIWMALYTYMRPITKHNKTNKHTQTQYTYIYIVPSLIIIAYHWEVIIYGLSRLYINSKHCHHCGHRTYRCRADYILVNIHCMFTPSSFKKFKHFIKDFRELFLQYLIIKKYGKYI